MDYHENLRLLAARTRFAVVAIWGAIATAGLVIIGSLLEAFGIADSMYGTAPLDLVVMFSYLAFMLAAVISIVCVGMWIYRAHANLWDGGTQGLEFTPGWAVGWYFIPFASLFKPYQAMQELFTASRLEGSPSVGTAPFAVRKWWACWLGGNVLANIGSKISDSANPDTIMTGGILSAVGLAIVVAAAVFLLQLIREVYAGQIGGATAAQVFA
ncbi:MAG: DUF4328 domain-containing protein [Croceibacterium sp.]